MSHLDAVKKSNGFKEKQDAVSASDMLRMSGASALQPMSPALRARFEPGLGADFSNVRISQGNIPEEMGIQAVAKGTDILMDRGAGMDVLGHELTHVVQQAQGKVPAGGSPVVHDQALEHEADVMGEHAASGMSAMAGSMITPMSDASAPAQCKTKEEKEAEEAAAKSAAAKQKNADLLANTAAPQKRELGRMVPLSQENEALIRGGQAIRELNTINSNIAPVMGPMREVKDSYMKSLVDSGFDIEESMKNVKEYQYSSGGKMEYNEESIGVVQKMFQMMMPYVETPEFADMAQQMYALHGTEGHQSKMDNSGGRDAYFLIQLLCKGVGGINVRNILGESDLTNSNKTRFITSLLQKNLSPEVLRRFSNNEDFPEDLRPLLTAYEPLREKMLAAAKGEAASPVGRSIAPREGQEYTTQADLPQSGADWSHTGSWKAMSNNGYNVPGARVDMMNGQSKPFGAEEAPKKKKGFLKRIFG